METPKTDPVLSKSSPKKKSTATLIGIIILCSIVAAAISAAAVFLWQRREKSNAIDSTKSDYEGRINTLQSEIDTLDAQLEDLQEEVDSETEEDSSETNGDEEVSISTDEAEGSDGTIQSVSPITANFFQSGNLLDTGNKLVYEEVGAAALEVDLAYNDDSYCVDGYAICDPRYLEAGQQVLVIGYKSGNTVTVAFMLVEY